MLLTYFVRSAKPLPILGKRGINLGKTCKIF